MRRKSLRLAAAIPLVLGAVACGGASGPTAGPGTPGVVNRDLLARIPPAIAATCVDLPVTDSGSLYGARCEPLSGASEASYVRFSERSTLNAAFNREWASHPLAVSGNRCEDGGEGVGVVTLADGAAGRYLCYPSDTTGEHWLYWTNEVLDILAYAATRDGDMAGLLTWWDSAGPTTAAVP